MTNRGAPKSVEHGRDYILEHWPGNLTAFTCTRCGCRTWDPEIVETKLCPRCGDPHDMALANELIIGLWL
jgi:NAD-dependent SIR2 family protein deacetylase